LSGRWSGTFTPTDGITSQPQAATATFKQDGHTVTGQLGISQPPAPTLVIAFNGTVSGTSVRGIATMSLFFCSLSGNVSGSIDNGEFRLTLPPLHGGNCEFLSTGEFVLHR
jgi:hypothetical protein